MIADSGIQFHQFQLDIDVNDAVISPIGFHEMLSAKDMKLSLEYAYFLPDSDIWVPKSFLHALDYIDESGTLKEHINYNQVKGARLKEEEDYYTISDISDAIDLFVSKKEGALWLPLPYFRKKANDKNTFGPTAWARAFFTQIPHDNKKIKSFAVTLAFDTRTDDNDPCDFALKTKDTADGENTFSLVSNEDLLLSFFSSEQNCAWVDRYLKQVVQGEQELSEFPRLKYLAYYIYLVRYFAATGFFPEIAILTDKTSAIDVDLVLDIGNSNTCGLLFENNADNKSFDLKSVKKLLIRDLTNPQQNYNDPFSMRLAFAEPRFGAIYMPAYKNFQWPSVLRVGEEAKHLMNRMGVDLDKGGETASHHSSPKRYLWDTSKTDVPWEFINLKGANVSPLIHFEGITEQFDASGNFAYDGNFGVLPTYSRKSLMTFVYIEIFLHALVQINSYEFRLEHGNAERPRRLRRITITCPTSIIQKEQVVLRECAVEAVRALTRYFNNQFIGDFDLDEEKSELEVVPSPKDLSKKLSELSFKRDWIFDEATCSQLVFLYAELSQRYLNKVDVFFKIYGGKKEDIPCLTIGSVDIGGGTTDVIIHSYQYESGQSFAVVKPEPLFWESFNIAGDDLLKEIVQQVVIEGKAKEAADEGCSGVIENSAVAAGVTDVAHKINNFFGTDSNQQTFRHRLMRKDFIVQVAVPIALRYLTHTIANKPDEKISYAGLFAGSSGPNSQVISYFNDHFRPLKFENIVWKLSAAKVNSIVETTFDALFKQLSAILSAYSCDFVLLAGRPTTIPKIREMFVKYYPVSPERLITLNQYRVGRWYPFADDIGYFQDPKTIVAVGAVIALMSGTLDKLPGFRLNTALLRKRLIATSDYMGVLNTYTQNIDDLFITPESNTAEIEVHSAPLMIGYKQLPNNAYKPRPVYKLDLNDKYIHEKVLEQNPALERERDLSVAIENFRNMLKTRMPLKVRLKRDWANSREILTIESIKDANKNEMSKWMLNLSFMTLPDEKGYWLDSGEFVLNIR